MENNTYIKSIEYYKGVTIVRLVGSFTIDNVHEAQEEWRVKMKDRPANNILFDLQEVKETDTSSLAVLIDLLRHMKDNRTGEKIGIINITKEMRDMAKVSRTEDLFNIYPSEEQAIRDLQK